MKKNFLYKLLLFSFTIILASSYNADAQIVTRKNPKKAKTVVLFPAPRKTKRMVTSQQNLPPGQAKKVYGTKSAKPFAPGQRKKQYHNSWPNYDQHEKGKLEEHRGNKKEKHDQD